jgi:hypothetical protein
MNDEAMEQQLVAVFEHYNLPEPRYGEQPMLCPVHDDRTPSASVNRAKGLWHCHACGAGGGAIALVQAMEQGSYQDACSMVESLSGATTAPIRATPRRTGGRRWIPPKLRRAI